MGCLRPPLQLQNAPLENDEWLCPQCHIDSEIRIKKKQKIKRIAAAGKFVFREPQKYFQWPSPWAAVSFMFRLSPRKTLYSVSCLYHTTMEQNRLTLIEALKSCRLQFSDNLIYNNLKRCPKMDNHPTNLESTMQVLYQYHSHGH